MTSQPAIRCVEAQGMAQWIDVRMTFIAFLYGNWMKRGFRKGFQLDSCLVGEALED